MEDSVSHQMIKVTLNPNEVYIDFGEHQIAEIRCANPDALWIWGKIKRSVFEDFQKITWDFQSVKYLNASGMGLLVELFLLARKEGKLFQIVNANGTVLKVLEVCKLQYLLS